MESKERKKNIPENRLFEHGLKCMGLKKDWLVSLRIAKIVRCISGTPSRVVRGDDTDGIAMQEMIRAQNEQTKNMRCKIPGTNFIMTMITFFLRNLNKFLIFRLDNTSGGIFWGAAQRLR